MNPCVEEDFIRIGVSHASHLRLIHQNKLDVPVATSKVFTEIRKIEVGIESVGADMHLRENDSALSTRRTRPMRLRLMYARRTPLEKSSRNRT